MKKLKINNSNKFYNKAIKIIPGGSQTFSKGPSNLQIILLQNILKNVKAVMYGM